MLSNLYLIQNMMIFLEECFVSLPKEYDFYTINPFYVKNADTFSSLQKDIFTLFPTLRFIPYGSCNSSHWNCIYMSSYMPPEHQNTITSLSYKKIILVEDGLFDYINPTYNYPFYSGKKLYLYKPEYASLCAKQSEIHGLIVNTSVLRSFESIYENDIKTIKSYPHNTDVLFTTPFSEDFGAPDTLPSRILDYLHDEMNINRVILKRHPRDHFTYKSNEIEIIECPQSIPGQFLDGIFDGQKIFLFPSTVSFMCGKLSDIVFINALPDNTEYVNAFYSVINSNLFKYELDIRVIDSPK